MGTRTHTDTHGHMDTRGWQNVNGVILSFPVHSARILFARMLAYKPALVTEYFLAFLLILASLRTRIPCNATLALPHDRQ